jgi:FMN phosphatase YigB (HAD superfamily)/DNA-binding XRE family transcriptional regulator
MDEKGLGQRLQAARKAAGFTQQDLCHSAQLSYSTLAKIERGAIKSPSVFTIQSIAQALGTGLDALLGIEVVGASHANVGPAKTKLVARNGVRFVYFDVNGCLVRFYHGAFAKLAADTNTRVDEVETAFWHLNDEACRGDISMDEFNHGLARSLNVASVDWAQYYLGAVEPIHVMHELVDWVADNYYVGLLTNIMPGMVKAMREKHILPSTSFTTIIDSSEVGAVKPERKIFEIATEYAGVQPGEIMLIDDDRTNLAAADRMGWKTLWFDGYNADDLVARIRDVLEPIDMSPSDTQK